MVEPKSSDGVVEAKETRGDSGKNKKKKKTGPKEESVV